MIERIIEGDEPMCKCTSTWSLWPCFLCVLSIGLVMPSPVEADMSLDRAIMSKLGLANDASDADIVRLLDDRKKRILATSFVKSRRIAAAIPKLMEMMREDDSSIYVKVSAADALCFLGNMEWIEQIKGLLSDPDVRLAESHKIQIAGLLALGGDYSQFEIVKRNIANEKRYIRCEVIESLGKFRSRNAKGDEAADLLLAVMMGDPDARMRDTALVSLERIARERPEIKSKIVTALEANLNCSDKKFQGFCRRKLERYRQDALTAQQVIEMLDDRTKFLTAISVITRRTMHSTAPKLLEMIEGEGTPYSDKLFAAKTLLHLGNTEWIKPMRVYCADPNLPISSRLLAAGLLARGGDYSQFDMVKTSLEGDDEDVRRQAAVSLGDFLHRKNQITLQAAQALEAAATRDANAAVRMKAITSLEKIVAERPDQLPVLIRVLQANVNSENPYLRKQCETMLKKYQEPPNQQ